MNIDQAKKLYKVWENDILAFAEYFFPNILNFKTPEFHKEIYDLLRTRDRLVLLAPRGFAKSSICSVIYPLWATLYSKRKDICIISASEGLAIEWLRKIKREIESNMRFIQFWGDLRSDKWSETHIILKFKDLPNIRARGAGGQIRGFRPDCLLLDDIETDESVESEEQRKKIKDWLFKACLNTLLPKGQFVIIGTAIHQLAVINDLYKVDNGWEKRCFKAYKDGIEEEGKELWKEMWSHEKLQVRKKEIGSWAFSSEYMNNPISNESAPVKEEHIRYWKDFPNQYSSVIAVDPAYSDDEVSDYKVAIHIAIDQNQNRYIASYIRTHAPIGEFQDSIINLWLSNKTTITAVGIPNSGTEKGFFDSFLKKCEDRKLYPPVQELKNVFTNSATSVSSRNKKARIVSALQPLFEQGKYYIHADHIEARDELLTIGSSRWDDLVDAMSYAEQILQPFYLEPEEKQVDRYGQPTQKQTVYNYGY